MMDLSSAFQEINQSHFDGALPEPSITWNSRLRTSAGRFIPGSRRLLNKTPAEIEIASYLLEEERARELILDTMAHEMIHYWLWIRKRPYGHTTEFLDKMKRMGVSRYNPVPKQRPYRYIYSCGACRREFPARRKLGALACAQCCQAQAGGKYDRRFKLFLKGDWKGTS